VIEALSLPGAAVVMGLFGSAHCFGMCAGISGLIAVNIEVASLRSQLPLALAYNTGRIISYALLGAAVGALGSGMVSAVPDVAAPVRLASGVLIVFVGLQLAFNWRVLAPLETAGSQLWRRIAPAARGLLPVRTSRQAVGLGLIWGWLPCGLVYSVLLVAAATASPLRGLAVMIAFGLGTMPAMIATGLGASRLARFMNRNRLGAGLMIALLGVATAAMPLAGLTGQREHSGHGSRTMPDSAADRDGDTGTDRAVSSSPQN